MHVNLPKLICVHTNYTVFKPTQNLHNLIDQHPWDPFYTALPFGPKKIVKLNCTKGDYNAIVNILNNYINDSITCDKAVLLIIRTKSLAAFIEEKKIMHATQEC